MEEIIFLICVLVGALVWIGYNLAKYNRETVSWIAEKDY